MTNDRASLQALVPAEVLGDLIHNWGWLLAQGILLVVLGTIGLGMTFWLTLGTVLISGFSWSSEAGFSFFRPSNAGVGKVSCGMWSSASCMYWPALSSSVIL